MTTDKVYSPVEVLNIIKAQLNTIPVSGQNVITMASVYNNIEVLIKAFTLNKENEVVNNGGTV